MNKLKFELPNERLEIFTENKNTDGGEILFFHLYMLHFLRRTWHLQFPEKIF